MVYETVTAVTRVYLALSSERVPPALPPAGNGFRHQVTGFRAGYTRPNSPAENTAHRASWLILFENDVSRANPQT